MTRLMKMLLLVSIATMPMVDGCSTNMRVTDEKPTSLNQDKQPDIYFYGDIDSNMQVVLRDYTFSRINNILKLAIHRPKGLENVYIIYYYTNKPFMHGYFIVNSNMNRSIHQEEAWYESYFSEPMVFDVNGDSLKDLVFTDGEETVEIVYVYLQQKEGFSLALQSPQKEHELLVKGSEGNEWIDNAYEFKNIDKDEELELLFKHLDIDGDLKAEKNVVYDLQDGKFVLISHE